MNSPQEEFRPLRPGSLRDLGIRNADIEAIILKFLLNSGPHIGLEIAKHIRLPLTLISGLLRQLKEEKLLVYKTAAAAGDFLYELSEVGIERARRYWEHCTYFGSVPVSLKDYIASVHAQSVRKQNPKIREIQKALDGLSVPPGNDPATCPSSELRLGVVPVRSARQREDSHRLSADPCLWRSDLDSESTQRRWVHHATVRSQQPRSSAVGPGEVELLEQHRRTLDTDSPPHARCGRRTDARQLSRCVTDRNDRCQRGSHTNEEQLRHAGD